jgi:hypothetical protein
MAVSVPSTQAAFKRYLSAVHWWSYAEVNLKQAQRFMRECEQALDGAAQYKEDTFGLLTYCRQQDIRAIVAEATEAGFEARDAEGPTAHSNVFELILPDGTELFYVSGMWVLDDNDEPGADVRLPKNRDDMGLTPKMIDFLTWSEDWLRALNGYWQSDGPYKDITTIEDFIAYRKSLCK